MRKPRPDKAVGDLDRILDGQIMEELTTLLKERTSFKDAYLLSEVYSKYVGPNTDSASLRKSRAIEKWLATELRNSRTNQRLLCDLADFRFATSDDVISSARAFILDVLGEEVPEEAYYGMFSNGASTSKRRGKGVVARKFAEKADVTQECWNLIEDRILAHSTWVSINGDLVSPNFVDGNIMFTVPKTSNIDRVAAKEPDLNMFVQKGFGDYIRSRLKLFGVNLDDQTRNQRLALEGSITGKLATVDLSSASDSISSMLVSALLPPSWFMVLDACRSKWTYIPTEQGYERHENSMFSSMGNGFTFELESLIFWALTRSVCRFLHAKGQISVYGDDIICPVSAFKALRQVFMFFGFKVNTKKSRYTGGFRESCGKHYFYGEDVSPFYVREPIYHQSRLIHFLNRFRVWSQIGSSGVCDPSLYSFWNKWRHCVDRKFWGGRDPERIDALVTRDPPKAVLVKGDRSVIISDSLQGGAYLHWLRTCDSRKVSFQWTGVRVPALRAIALQAAALPDPTVTSQVVVDGRWVARFSRGTSRHRDGGVTPVWKQEYE